jgi:hypothetical protein
MGNRITIKQNNFSNGMQGDTRKQNLIGQTEVLGASMIKHFDIYEDASKLSPNPSFERWNTESEEDFGIVALGSDYTNEKVIGLGKAFDNWADINYSYRVLLTPDTSSSNIDYTFIDLSYFGSDFWDNVSDDGSEIRVYPTDHDYQISTHLYQFDKVANEGYLFIDLHSTQDVYMYFGNVEVSSEGEIKIKQFFSDNLSDAFTLDGNLDNYVGNIALDDSSVSYATGLVLPEGISNSTPQSAFSSSSPSFSTSFYYKWDGVSQASLFNYRSQASLSINGSGILNFESTDMFDPADDFDLDSSTALVSGNWYYINITVNEDDYAGIFIDGVQVANQDIDSGLAEESGQPYSINTGGSVMQLLTVQEGASGKTVSENEVEGLMHRTDFWTMGSLQVVGDVTLNKSGVAVYSKDFSGTDWSLEYFSGKPVADSSSELEPIEGFIEYTGDSSNKYIFQTLDTSEDKVYGSIGGYSVTNTVLESFGMTAKYEDLLTPEQNMLPSSSYAIDKEYYVGYGGIINGFNSTDKWIQEVYNPFGKGNVAVPYGYSLAIAGTRDGVGYIEIWDLTNSDPTTVIKTGIGNIKTIVNEAGKIITVNDLYLDNENLSLGSPSLNFKVWNGGDEVEEMQIFKYETRSKPLYETWQGFVHQKVVQIKNASTFYAEPSDDQTGMWAIGKTGGNIAISIPYDTSQYGYIVSYSVIGNNVIIVNTDNEIYRVNTEGTYSNTSVFESLEINAGVRGIEKDLVAVEVVLSDDPGDQVVTISYSVDGGDYETIGTCDAKVTEFTLADGEPFSSFNEVKIKITSTNGDVDILEYSLLVEYEEELL